jgi:hypothetical protein
MVGISGVAEIDLKILSYLIPIYSVVLRSVCKLWRDVIPIDSRSLEYCIHCSIYRKERTLLSYYMSTYSSFNFKNERNLIYICLTNDISYISYTILRMNIEIKNLNSLFLECSHYFIDRIQLNTLKYLVSLGFPIYDLNHKELILCFRKKISFIEWLIEENRLKQRDDYLDELCKYLSPYYINKLISNGGRFSNESIHFAIMGFNIPLINFLLLNKYRDDFLYNTIISSLCSPSQKIEMINCLLSHSIPHFDISWCEIRDIEVLKHFFSLEIEPDIECCLSSGEPEIIEYLLEEDYVPLSSSLYSYVNYESKTSLPKFLLSKGIQWPGDIIWENKIVEINELLEYEVDTDQSRESIDNYITHILSGYVKYDCPISSTVKRSLELLNMNKSVSFLTQHGID